MLKTSKTSKPLNSKKILAEADDLLQQVGPEAIENSKFLKKLKFERGRLAAAATPRPATPEKKIEIPLPAAQELPEPREVIQTPAPAPPPAPDLSPAEQTAFPASKAQPSRRTLIRWGLAAMLAVLILAAGYQWQQALVAERARKEAEESAQAAEKARNLTKRDLSVSYDSLGNVSLQLGDLKTARDYFVKYLSLAEQLAQQDPDSAQARRDLSVAYDRMGDVSLQLGDLKGAKEYFEKSLHLRGQLAQQDQKSAQAWRDLAVSYERLGNMSLKLGELKTAREYFEKYLNLSEQLAQQDPDSVQTRRDLSVSYERLGNMSLKSGDLKGAQDYFQKALNLREQLAQQDPGSARARARPGGFLQLPGQRQSAGRGPEGGPGILSKSSEFVGKAGPSGTGKRPRPQRPVGLL